MEKIEFQEKRYDALNEKIQELKTAGQDTKIQNNLLAQLSEKDGLLEKQQNELNDARATIARLRNEMDSMRKERETLEKRTEELEKEAAGRSSMTEAEPEKAGSLQRIWHSRRQECRKLLFIRRYRGRLQCGSCE